MGVTKYVEIHMKRVTESFQGTNDAVESENEAEHFEWSAQLVSSGGKVDRIL